MLVHHFAVAASRIPIVFKTVNKRLTDAHVTKGDLGWCWDLVAVVAVVVAVVVVVAAVVAVVAVVAVAAAQE